MRVVLSVGQFLTPDSWTQRFFSRTGLTEEDIIRVAFGHAMMSCTSGPVYCPERLDIFTQMHRLLTERSRYPDEVATASNVHFLLDLVGRTSFQLADVLLRQLGRLPAGLRILQFTGRDLVLTFSGQ